ncbi:MAG: hypothetical protein ACSLFB_01440 [Acidimicrobiales bacterium]
MNSYYLHFRLSTLHSAAGLKEGPDSWSQLRSTGILEISPVHQGGIMSENTANQPAALTTPITIAELLRDVEPMGNLGRLVIDDLSPEEEDEFYRILEDA